MLRTAALAQWFEDNGSSVPVSYDDLPESSPVNAAAVRISGGLGLETEDALDRPTFTLYVRGANGGVAEDLGAELDAIWLDAPQTFMVGDSQVKGKGRFGSPPAFVAKDDNGKVLRAATYWCRIER